jgi:hypothetical protein
MAIKHGQRNENGLDTLEDLKDEDDEDIRATGLRDEMKENFSD